MIPPPLDPTLSWSVAFNRTFFSDSDRSSGRAPLRLADQINSSSLRSSTAPFAASFPYLAFAQPNETHSGTSDFPSSRFPSLRMDGAKWWHRPSCNKAEPPIRPQSNGNGYASVEALKTDNRSVHTRPSPAFGNRSLSIEEMIERVIFDCRFFTLMAILGSLAGSLLCFFKGCLFVIESFSEYIHASLNGFDTGQVILLLVEAVDVYLMGTVMLIFGMGFYELFVNSIAVPKNDSATGSRERNNFGSNLFGLFQLRKRPFWLEIRSLDELKTKLGHVIVMILLVGMFEKSKKVPVNSGMDLLCFSASILMSSGCLFLLSKLNTFK